jgi:type III secretory pathway component EscS
LGISVLMWYPGLFLGINKPMRFSVYTANNTVFFIGLLVFLFSAATSISGQCLANDLCIFFTYVFFFIIVLQLAIEKRILKYHHLTMRFFCYFLLLLTSSLLPLFSLLYNPENTQNLHLIFKIIMLLQIAATATSWIVIPLICHWFYHYTTSDYNGRYLPVLYNLLITLQLGLAFKDV